MNTKKVIGYAIGVVSSIVFIATAHVAMAQGESLNEKLLEACKESDLAVVKQLINEGADIHTTDSRGRTPLHYAVAFSHFGMKDRVDLIKYLIGKGADVNAQDSEGDTPLHPAAYSGHPSLVSVLIKNGANLKIKNKDGRTPLHELMTGAEYTETFNVVKIAKILLKAGASLQSKDSSGKTPLDLCKKPFIRKYLLNDLSSLTSFDALDLRDIGLLQRNVQSSSQATAKNDKGYTLLQAASSLGFLDAVKYLIDNGANINYVFKGEKAFSTGISGFVSIMEYVESPLILSLENRHWEVAKYLVQNGADVNIVGKIMDFVCPVMVQGEIIPIVFASRFGQKELVELMILHKADVNLAESDGATALMEAARKGDIQIAKILVKAENGVKSTFDPCC